MAKKAKTSARSKGYRKTVQKKPFLTKKRLSPWWRSSRPSRWPFLLFNLLYDDGSLDVVDGVVQTENFDNSVIVQDHIGDETKYFKVAEVGELEGYTREREENSANATSPPLSIRQKMKLPPSTTSASPAARSRRMDTWRTTCSATP